MVSPRKNKTMFPRLRPRRLEDYAGSVAQQQPSVLLLLQAEGHETADTQDEENPPHVAVNECPTCLSLRPVPRQEMPGVREQGGGQRARVYMRSESPDPGGYNERRVCQN